MKKGFTLIELLAVIAILALLVVIAVPKILKVFKEAKTNAFEVEVENVLETIEQGYAASLIKKGTLETTTYTYDEEGNLDKEGNVDITFSGKKLKNTTIIVTETGEISFVINNGELCAKKTNESEEIIYPELSECELSTVDCSSCFVFNESIGEITGYNSGVCPACSSEVVIPSTINEVPVVGIGDNAFQNKGITSLSLPVGITYIGDYAFSNNSLSTLSTPNTIFSYGEGAFSNNQLTSLTISFDSHFGCLTLEIGADAFRYNLIPQGSASIGAFLSQMEIGVNAFANNGTNGQTLITPETAHGVPEKC